MVPLACCCFVIVCWWAFVLAAMGFVGLRGLGFFVFGFG